ncbi:MAG TPA: YlxR family protein [Candidatus Dormibacteraeota bacterium]|jgi:predicted RNA-binding protein YlxR (DUF448 family)
MPKTAPEPVRTCVACREEAGKWALIRFTRTPEGVVVEDPTGRAPGRGAYLHDRPACRALALKKRSLERALRSRAGEVPAASKAAKRG